MKEELKQMLSWGVIKESHSGWEAPIVMVQKKRLNEEEPPEYRLCVDYRQFNKII